MNWPGHPALALAAGTLDWTWHPGLALARWTGTGTLERDIRVVIFISSHILRNFSVLAGGRCPPDPPVFGWGGKAPPDPPLKRSFVTFDRGGQTGPPRSNDFFFGAADDTRAARTSGLGQQIRNLPLEIYPCEQKKTFLFFNLEFKLELELGWKLE